MMCIAKPYAWNKVRRVLCIRLDSLGDVLMTAPAIRALRSLPHLQHITLLTSPRSREVAELLPEIDDVWTAEVAWLKHCRQRISPAPEWQLIAQMATADFDGCVIFTVLTQSALPSAMACYLAGIPLRLAHSRENPYQLLTDWVDDTETLDNARHEVVRQLDLVRSIGATIDDDRLRLSLPRKIQVAMQQRLASLRCTEKDKWCVIHPGATASSRRYPAECYAIVASELEQLGFRIFLTGQVDEASLLQTVATACKQAVVFPGCLKVDELAALIAAAPVLITNNTGPAHIAAAVGTPVVDLYALTNPQHTPWRVPQRVLNFDVPCRNCLKSICPEGHHDCLRKVTPHAVLQAVLDLWNTSQFGTSSPGNQPLCTH